MAHDDEVSVLNPWKKMYLVLTDVAVLVLTGQVLLARYVY